MSPSTGSHRIGHAHSLIVALFASCSDMLTQQGALAAFGPEPWPCLSQYRGGGSCPAPYWSSRGHVLLWGLEERSACCHLCPLSVVLHLRGGSSGRGPARRAAPGPTNQLRRHPPPSITRRRRRRRKNRPRASLRPTVGTFKGTRRRQRKEVGLVISR